MNALTPQPLNAEAPQTQRAAARTLAALGRLYVSQGRPRQGLALLLSAKRLGAEGPAVTRNIAHALILAGAAQKALPLLDHLEPTLTTPEARRAGLYLRSRALLALGRVEEARAVFAARRDIE